MKETLLLVSSDEEKFLIEDPKLYDTTLVKIYCVFDRWRKTCANLSADQFKTLVAIWFSGLSHAYDSFLVFTLTSQRKLLILSFVPIGRCCGFQTLLECTCLSFIFTARCIKSLAKCKLSNTVQSSLVFTQRKESSTATGFDWKYLWHCSKFIRHLGPRRRCFWSLSTATNRNGSETSIPGKCDNNRLLKSKQPIVH